MQRGAEAPCRYDCGWELEVFTEDFLASKTFASTASRQKKENLNIRNNKIIKLLYVHIFCATSCCCFLCGHLGEESIDICKMKRRRNFHRCEDVRGRRQITLFLAPREHNKIVDVVGCKYIFFLARLDGL